MKNYSIFFCSDHHFGHRNLYESFKLADGSPARPWPTSEEATEAIVENHNKVVKPQDRVYFVGDVAMGKTGLTTVGRMNGRKVLIKGNHDILDLKEYLPYFDDVRGSHQFSGILVTHIPVHPDSLARWGFNVHGHLHTHNVMIDKYKFNDFSHITTHYQDYDPRYFNVSLEQINYTPISFEEVRKYKPNES